MTAQKRVRDKAGTARLGTLTSGGRFMRLPDMVKSTGLSESTIRRRVLDGEMPKPVALTKRCVGWWERDYLAWAQARPPVDAPSAAD